MKLLKNNSTLVFLLLLVIVVSCKEEKSVKVGVNPSESIPNLIPYVNPFVGTKKNGTYIPGANSFRSAWYS